MSRAHVLVLLTLSAMLTIVAAPAPADDWPQFQHDAQRTGRSADSVAPPYRARWIWLGPDKTLRNKQSNPDWTDDLTTGRGKNYDMPAKVDFTLGEMMQPVVAKGMVFVASLEGTVFAINADDGSTAWQAPIPGGSLMSGLVAGDVVVFCAIPGGVYGYEVATGKPLWTVETPKATVSAPCELGGTVYAACQDGRVYAIEAATGKQLWASERMGGLIQCTPAATKDAVYVGAEDLIFYKIDAASGKTLARRQLFGQSFRLLWPVIAEGHAWVTTVPAQCVGSEYVLDPLFASATSLEDEERKLQRWLNGDTNNGQWALAAKGDWRSFYALDLKDLSEPYMVLAGPVDGCGQPPDPPVVDSKGRILRWWPTRYPSITKVGNTFGTKYSVDLAGVDTTNGRRKPIEGAKLSGIWPIETDNLFGLSTGGNYCYLRQNFRGTYAMRLDTSSHIQIQVQARDRDGGVWNAPIMYIDNYAQDAAKLPKTAHRGTQGRVGLAIAGKCLYFTENYGVTAVEQGQ